MPQSGCSRAGCVAPRVAESSQCLPLRGVRCAAQVDLALTPACQHARNTWCSGRSRRRRARSAGRARSGARHWGARWLPTLSLGGRPLPDAPRWAHATPDTAAGVAPTRLGARRRASPDIPRCRARAPDAGVGDAEARVWPTLSLGRRRRRARTVAHAGTLAGAMHGASTLGGPMPGSTRASVARDPDTLRARGGQRRACVARRWGTRGVAGKGAWAPDAASVNERRPGI